MGELLVKADLPGMVADQAGSRSFDHPDVKARAEFERKLFDLMQDQRRTGVFV